MNVAPPMEIPAHLQRRRRRRSSAHHDERLEEKEMMLLRAGIRPEWLTVHRIINVRYCCCPPSWLFTALCVVYGIGLAT